MKKKKPTKPAPKKARRKSRTAPAPAPRPSPAQVAAKLAAEADLGEKVAKAQQFDELMATAVGSPFEELLTKALKPSTARTRGGRWQESFLEALTASCNVTVACRVAGIDRATAYDHKKASKQFEARWVEALEGGVELMEAELHRRAFEGTLRPIYQGGAMAGMVRDFSDTLGIFLLKAHKPEKYRERISVKNETPRRPIDPAQAAAAVARFLGEVEPGPAAAGSGAGGEGGSAD